MIRPKSVKPCLLGEAIPECSDLATARLTVTGVTTDNRAVQAGDLFIGVPGVHNHGAHFADAAVSAGAVAVATDELGADLVEADIPIVVVPDIAKKVGEIAAAIYGYPARKLTTYAITGTNGKTTTAFMIDHILQALGETTGLIGTVAIRIAGVEVPAQLTTPQPADLQAMLAALVEEGGTSLVMEASSHALAQGRINPIRFSVAGFTNLTQDHLDYHKTLADYFEAKAQLFDNKHAQSGVVIADTRWGQILAEREADRMDQFYTETRVPGAWSVRSHADHSFTVTNPHGEEITTYTAMPGAFNISNAALAIAMVAKAGYALDDIANALTENNGVSPTVPGRMELVGKRPRVVVDFAHNEDALVQAITALRPETHGRLVVITGSAGDRDKEKRPAMANAVATRADVLVITDDDPHSEDPAVIRSELIAGIPGQTNWIEIADRTQAIEQTIQEAQPEDTILIAGRGHERFQDMNGTLIELDDRDVARAALARRKAQG
ncbi:UDP-N-acetylmuramoyl-L-alanyl-D-glutamate--2,6-diaminopimelate ligase [Arcanobacterium phocae]|uniref:UDP-N-acetylmuramoyl-L-alanyl-D-glutamate--2, 6-diaminopimelate ligase n=1 Tax=Arcanobacterium phocae TaxID=131112 RepID=UPI001C0EFDDA|nr:UDP-N-acetylmuramoyl-L-alanyl-D-glutamate--2,6-diaminopimelate ligase [Arcanobacterium phocae]